MNVKEWVFRRCFTITIVKNFIRFLPHVAIYNCIAKFGHKMSVCRLLYVTPVYCDKTAEDMIVRAVDRRQLTPLSF